MKLSMERRQSKRESNCPRCGWDLDLPPPTSTRSDRLVNTMPEPVSLARREVVHGEIVEVRPNPVSDRHRQRFNQVLRKIAEADQLHTSTD